MGQIIERGPSEQAECLSKEFCRPPVVPCPKSVPPFPKQDLESLKIELAVLHPERVTRSVAHDARSVTFAPESPTQARHVGVQRVTGRRRWRGAPKAIEEAIT